MKFAEIKTKISDLELATCFNFHVTESDESDVFHVSESDMFHVSESDVFHVSESDIMINTHLPNIDHEFKRYLIVQVVYSIKNKLLYCVCIYLS